MDRLLEIFPFEVPKSHVHRAHRADRHGTAAEIHRSPIHFLPEPFGFERILVEQYFAQAAGDIMTEGGVDDRLDDLRRSVGLANTFEAVVGADPYQHHVLAACGLLLDGFHTEDLADDTVDFHGVAGGWGK